MATLLELGGDMAALLALLDESGGEITPENEAALEAFFAEIGDAQTDKVDAYVAVIREHQLRAAARKEEQERLALRVQADDNTAKRLKERLKFYMEQTQQRKIETRRYRVSVAANGGKTPVEVRCLPAALPPAYQRVTIAADLDAIRTDLEGGRDVPGAVLGVRGTHLRIA